jgi:magnesium transporter
VGVLSLRELMLRPSAAPVREFMHTPVRSVAVGEDQEAVAHLFREYDYLAVPVVDAAERIIGVITVDDILDVLEEEESEDVQRMVGAGADERVDSPVDLSLRRRLPWLLINLATAAMSAVVIGVLDEAIDRIQLAVIFMPVIVQVAGNAGAQSLAVVFRVVILDEGGSHRVARILQKALVLGALNGLPVGVVSGLLAAVFVYMDKGTMPPEGLTLCQVVAGAMFVSMTLGSVVGAAIPLLMRRLGWDPAQNSHILLTAITDMTGLAIYLGMVILFVSSHPGG